MHRTSRARFPSPALVCVSLALAGAACQRTRPSGEPSPRATAVDAQATSRADVTRAAVDAGEGALAGPLAEARPAVTVGALARDALPTQPYVLPADGVLPRGCFAWSPRTLSAACTTGLVGHNMGAAESDGPGGLQPGWGVAFVGDRARPINLFERGGSVEDFSVDAPLTPATRARLVAALDAGGYVPLAPLYRRLRAGTPLAWAPGSTLLWTRRRTSRAGDNAAARYTDTLSLRWRAEEAPTVVTTREDAPVDAPEYAAYFIPGERFVVLSSLAQHGDEGVSGQTAEAWRCDRTTRRCE